MREIIHNIGGGVTNTDGTISTEGFKAVQIGGPSGGCLTQAHLDLPLDFDSLKEVGAMVGSGGLVVMNQQTCMVSVAQFFMRFTQNESCGKCVLCREGTKQLLSMLEDITSGQATEEIIPLMEQLAHVVQKGSLCGLGKTAPNPVLSTLRYFLNEYEAHVIHKRCPANQCKALRIPEIDPAKCGDAHSVSGHVPPMPYPETGVKSMSLIRKSVSAVVPVWQSASFTQFI